MGIIGYMSKEYVMQLESTIENYKRDNKILKEELFKYRELEKQLGCPLEVLFKAFKNGNIWVNKNEQIVNICDFYLDCNGCGYWFLSIGKGYYDIVGLKDYKKTWWLKKDKSE